MVVSFVLLQNVHVLNVFSHLFVGSMYMYITACSSVLSFLMTGLFNTVQL